MKFLFLTTYLIDKVILHGIYLIYCKGVTFKNNFQTATAAKTILRFVMVWTPLKSYPCFIWEILYRKSCVCPGRCFDGLAAGNRRRAAGGQAVKVKAETDGGAGAERNSASSGPSSTKTERSPKTRSQKSGTLTRRKEGRKIGVFFFFLREQGRRINARRVPRNLCSVENCLPVLTRFCLFTGRKSFKAQS